MGKQTILIADKDSDFRKFLQQVIREQGYPATIWECTNGLEALNYMNALQPDLAILNVLLPGKPAFDVLDNTSHLPPVIFVCDSPDYAAQAFDYPALDYILKPAHEHRLLRALQKFGGFNEQPPDDPSPNSQTVRYPTRILVEKGNRLVNIPVNEITHVKADKDYSWIYTLNGEHFLSTHGIGQLERKLNPQQFLRIHRSYIVNIDCIQELYRDISKLFVALPNDIEIHVGRNYLPVVKELMF